MKHRYITLDAMRGVAAIFVAARHFSELYGPSTPHFSYLAVDIFFLLSGFVLSLSYGDKLAQGMTPREFLIRRVIRLFPLYLLGTALSLLVAFWHFSQASLPGATPGSMVLAGAAALLMLPSHAFSLFLFSFMVPAWSLFFELYVANAAFAVLRGRATDRLLLSVIIPSLILLLLADAFRGSLEMGSQWHTALGGVPRTLFSFFLGVYLQRLHRRHPPRLQFHPGWWSRRWACCWLRLFPARQEEFTRSPACCCSSRLLFSGARQRANATRAWARRWVTPPMRFMSFITRWWCLPGWCCRKPARAWCP